MKSKGPRNPGQATKVYNHACNGKPVSEKKSTKKGSKKNG